MNKVINKVKTFFSILMIGLLFFRLGNTQAMEPALYGLFLPQVTWDLFLRNINKIGLIIFFIVILIIQLKLYQKKGVGVKGGQSFSPKLLLSF